MKELNTKITCILTKAMILKGRPYTTLGYVHELFLFKGYFCFLVLT